MSLTDKEKQELEMLDNPAVQFMSSASGFGGVISSLFGKTSTQNRKERVVKLRTKMKMEELGLDEKTDWQKYYQIEKEEIERFDKRFNK